MRAKKRLVTRITPNDHFGAHVLLNGTQVQEGVAENTLRELLASGRIIGVKPCDPTNLKCYGLAAVRAIQAGVAVKRFAGEVRSRTGGLNAPKKPRSTL
jgi:hypothetical protein